MNLKSFDVGPKANHVAKKDKHLSVLLEHGKSATARERKRGSRQEPFNFILARRFLT